MRCHFVDEQVDGGGYEVVVERTGEDDGAGRCSTEEGVNDESKIDVGSNLATALCLFEQAAHPMVFRAQHPILNDPRQLGTR